MDEKEIKELKQSLAIKLEKYISIIKEEYKDFIPIDTLNFLNVINKNAFDLLDFINKSVDNAIESSTLDLDAKTGILLVSHGSRLKYNKEFISALHEKYATNVDYPTNFGFMELVGPSIPESIFERISRKISAPFSLSSTVTRYFPANSIPTFIPSRVVAFLF